MKANAVLATLLIVIVLVIIVAAMLVFYYPTLSCEQQHAGNITAIGECMGRISAP